MTRPSIDFSHDDMVATRVAAVITSVCAFIPVLATLWPGQPIHWRSEGQDAPAAVDGLSPGASARHSGDLVWQIDSPTLAQRALAALPWLVLALLVVAGAVIVWRLVGEVFEDQPFTDGLGRRLRSLGVLLLLGPLLWGAAQALSQMMLSGSVLPRAQASFGISLGDVWPVGCGLLLLALAKLVPRGQRMAADTEGLV